jgi:hypothetical protein
MSFVKTFVKFTKSCQTRSLFNSITTYAFDGSAQYNTQTHTHISFDFPHKIMSNISLGQLNHFFIKLHIATTKAINDGITFKTLDTTSSALRLYALNNVKCRFTI